MEFFLLLMLLFFLCLTAIGLSKYALGGKAWVFSPVVIFVAYFLMRDFGGVAVASIEINSVRPIAGFIAALLAINLAAITIGVCFPRQLHVLSVDNVGDQKIFYFYIFLGIVSVIFTFAMLGRVPLFYAFASLFDGGAADLSMHEARRMNTVEHHDGDAVYFGQGYFRIIYTLISPFFLCLLMVHQVVKYGKLTHSTKLLIVFFLVAAILNGQIWIAVNQIILYFLFFIFSRVLVGEYKIGKVVAVTVGAYVLIVVFIFLFRYLQTLSGRDIEDFVFSTFSRMYSYPQGELFIIFPEYHPFRYGSTWLTDLSGLLPGSVQSFAYEVHYLIHGGGWGYTLSPGFVASAYVNFGYFGIFFFIYVLSVLFVFLYRVMIASRSFLVKGLAILVAYNFAIGFGAEIAVFVVALITAFLMYMSYKALSFCLVRE